jgi:hypothetical protein
MDSCYVQLVKDINNASRPDSHPKRYVSIHLLYAGCFTSQLVKDINNASRPDSHPGIWKHNVWGGYRAVKHY